MGWGQSKLEKPNANVINTVKIVDHTSHLNDIWWFLLILILLSSVKLFIKLYSTHNKFLKKRYTQNEGVCKL